MCYNKLVYNTSFNQHNGLKTGVMMLTTGFSISESVLAHRVVLTGVSYKC